MDYYQLIIQWNFKSQRMTVHPDWQCILIGTKTNLNTVNRLTLDDECWIHINWLLHWHIERWKYNKQ